MKGLNGLVVKIAERCNLNCSYCYMYNHVDQSYKTKPAFMEPRVFSHLADRIVEHVTSRSLSAFGLTLHGGEPMLAPPGGVRRFLTELHDRLPCAVSVGIQTNATLITPDWLALIRDFGIQVGVSLDGPASVHDRDRVTASGGASHHRVVSGVRTFQAHGIVPNILCVVNGGDGLASYLHFRELGIRKMNFLFPDVSHDHVKRRASTPIADFLIPVFDNWFGEDDPDVSIRLFESIIGLLLGGTSNTESLGGGAVDYLVIDTDGSILGNDCLKVCDEGLAESGLNVRSSGFDDLSVGLPLVHRLVTAGLPLPTDCAGCPEVRVCGGGGVPNRYSRVGGFDNPSVWCADLKKLICHVRRVISPHSLSTLAVRAHGERRTHSPSA